MMTCQNSDTITQIIMWHYENRNCVKYKFVTHQIPPFIKFLKIYKMQFFAFFYVSVDSFEGRIQSLILQHIFLIC